MLGLVQLKIDNRCARLECIHSMEKHLADALNAWAESTHWEPVSTMAWADFDALVARVRELEAENAAALANGKRVWESGERWFDQMVTERQRAEKAEQALAEARAAVDLICGAILKLGEKVTTDSDK